MNQPQLINPDGKLLPEVEQRLFAARKTKPLWAKLVKVEQEVETLEGRETVEPGHYLCRGIHNELWPQDAIKLLSNYQPTDHFDTDGWQQFSPKPDAAPVQAAQIATPFSVMAHWGKLTGKADDYIVRSSLVPTDVWIVDKAIFEASYERLRS